MDDFERELKLEFINEARDLMQDGEASFLDLENDPLNEELHDEIFRLAHNLKGSSRAAGFDEIAKLTHAAENLILKIKNKEITADVQVVTILLNFSDAVNQMIEALSEDLAASHDVDELIENINAIAA